MTDQIRVKKINELLKREIGKIISQELDFADVLVTVTKVDTSSNLIQVKTYVSVYPKKEEEKVFNFLNRSIYFLQQSLNKRMRIRPVPKIIFEKETEVEKAAKIEETIETLKKK